MRWWEGACELMVRILVGGAAIAEMTGQRRDSYSALFCRR